jgi:exodeoxyribonuclease-1
MAHTYFFYDLETSGLNARTDRIMQFAGQRTDTELNPIGEAYNVLIRLNDDTLPSPEAILVTGITPQQTVEDGVTEAEFARLLIDDICLADTMTVGFNNIRFDDEFIRCLLWRNFHDPYEWCWKNGCSRWDILDVVRMTRALRPDGIEWPIVDGKATNRLELITKLNGIEHLSAHDALSDVDATIAVARLIKERQPQLFDYLLDMRDKKRVMKLINLATPAPFVYTSGRYEEKYHKTTVAYPLAPGTHGTVIVYDLRYDPSKWIGMSLGELKKNLTASWEDRKRDGFVPVPVKELHYNRSPAVAPLGVLAHGGGWERIGLDQTTIEKHCRLLMSAPDFAENIRSLCSEKPSYPAAVEPEARLYDSFLNDHDRLRVETVRNAAEHDLTNLQPEFQDERLSDLLLHYKARSFPGTLSEDEAAQWERWRADRINRQMPAFTASLQKLAAETSDEGKQFILQELQLWAESILPADVYDGTEESEVWLA